MNIRETFAAAGFSVEYRRLDVCVTRGGERHIVCYKYAGGGNYEEELRTAYDRLVSSGVIDIPPTRIVCNNGNPFLTHAKKQCELRKDTAHRVSDEVECVDQINWELIHSLESTIEKLLGAKT